MLFNGNCSSVKKQHMGEAKFQVKLHNGKSKDSLSPIMVLLCAIFEKSFTEELAKTPILRNVLFSPKRLSWESESL